jgi:hypothetical protein
MGRLARVVVLVLLALVPSAAVAGPAEEASALINRYAEAFNKNDVDALVKLYAPEAILLSSVDPSIHQGPSPSANITSPCRAAVGRSRLTSGT